MTNFYHFDSKNFGTIGLGDWGGFSVRFQLFIVLSFDRVVLLLKKNDLRSSYIYVCKTVKIEEENAI